MPSALCLLEGYEGTGVHLTVVACCTADARQEHALKAIGRSPQSRIDCASAGSPQLLAQVASMLLVTQTKPLPRLHGPQAPGTVTCIHPSSDSWIALP